MTVDLYTGPSCIQCKMTKKHLTKRGIPFTESDADTIAEKAKAAGVQSLPIVVVDGHIAFGGYRPDQLDALTS